MNNTVYARRFLRALLVCVILLAIAVAVQGCVPATLTKADQTRLVVQYGVMKHIDDDPAKANAWLDGAQSLRQYLDGSEEVSILDLEEVARSQVPWQSMDAADRMLVDAVLGDILAAVQAELADKVAQGKLSPEQKVQVLGFVSWVERAAYMSGADG